MKMDIITQIVFIIAEIFAIGFSCFMVYTMFKVKKAAEKIQNNVKDLSDSLSHALPMFIERGISGLQQEQVSTIDPVDFSELKNISKSPTERANIEEIKELFKFLEWKQVEKKDGDLYPTMIIEMKDPARRFIFDRRCYEIISDGIHKEYFLPDKMHKEVQRLYFVNCVECEGIGRASHDEFNFCPECKGQGLKIPQDAILF